MTDGSCSLFGKVPDCESGEQGSIPAATHDGLSFNGQRILRYERRDECSNHSKPTIWTMIWVDYKDLVEIESVSFESIKFI